MSKVLNPGLVAHCFHIVVWSRHGCFESAQVIPSGGTESGRRRWRGREHELGHALSNAITDQGTDGSAGPDAPDTADTLHMTTEEAWALAISGSGKVVQTQQRGVSVPANYGEAMRSEHSKAWRDAMEAEITAHYTRPAPGS